MANGTRTLTLLVVLILGLAAGWYIGHGKPTPPPAPEPTPVPVPTVPVAPTPVPTPPGPYPHAGNWTLTVGPDACDVTQNGQKVPVAVIGRGQHNFIRFQPDAGQLLGIVIHVPSSYPKPFKNLTPAGSDPQGNALWAVVCAEPGNRCFTGPAEPNAQPGYYKYDQVLNGKVCDAGIIIQP